MQDTVNMIFINLLGEFLILSLVEGARNGVNMF